MRTPWNETVREPDVRHNAARPTRRLGRVKRPLRAWQSFAGSLRAMPVTEIPVAGLILGLLALVLAGNLLSAGPAAIAARTSPAIALRAE
jgi:hypothetical protein